MINKGRFFRAAAIALSLVMFPLSLCAQEEEEGEKEVYHYEMKEVVIPAKKRPRQPDSSRLKSIEEKDDSKSGDEYIKKCSDTFKYGLEEEISSLIDELTENEDVRFVDPIYDLFYKSKNTQVKKKILSYFTKLKDPCLEEYAVSVLNDPYDEKKDTVDACFQYVSEIKCTAALPCLVKLIDKEDEQYFTMALSTLGDIGTAEEAQFLISFLERDDLTTPQKQQLMKVLGKIKAVETFDRLAEIARDTDENSFVRMYAAEAIGAMKVAEAEDILIDLFESDDPNFRVYVVKGISNFEDEKADELLLQALRDSQWKVRLEAINTVGERQLSSAAPFLIYRCKDSKEEKNVKKKAYSVLAKLNTSEGNEYLVSVIKDEKAADATKGTVAAALLEYNNAGTKEIIELAEKTLEKDTMKNLRYTLGKEFAKYGRPEYEDICSKYLDSKDVATQGTGLDIFAKGKYSSCRSKVEEIAKEEDSTGDPKKPVKKNANQAKAKKILERLNSYQSSSGEVEK